MMTQHRKQAILQAKLKAGSRRFIANIKLLNLKTCDANHVATDLSEMTQAVY